MSQSMNGLEIITDGIATLENGDLTCNDIYANNLTSSRIYGSTGTYFSGLSSNIQTQLNKQL